MHAAVLLQTAREEYCHCRGAESESPKFIIPALHDFLPASSDRMDLYERTMAAESPHELAYILQQDAADGLYYHEQWKDMQETVIISDGMDATRLPAIFGNLDRLTYGLQQDAADGPYYYMEWEDMKESVIISDGMHATRVPVIFGNLDNILLSFTYMVQQDAAVGPYYHTGWEDMKATDIDSDGISGGMNALRLPAF